MEFYNRIFETASINVAGIEQISCSDNITFLSRVVYLIPDTTQTYMGHDSSDVRKREFSIQNKNFESKVSFTSLQSWFSPWFCQLPPLSEK